MQAHTTRSGEVSTPKPAYDRGYVAQQAILLAPLRKSGARLGFRSETEEHLENSFGDRCWPGRSGLGEIGPTLLRNLEMCAPAIHLPLPQNSMENTALNAVHYSLCC